MTWNPKPIRRIDSNQTEKPRSEQTKAQVSGLVIDVAGVEKLIEDFETLRASVWENTDKVVKLHTQIDSLTRELAVEIGKLKEQQDRIEMSLVPILELVDEKRKTNAHLEEVLCQLQDHLNQ